MNENDTTQAYKETSKTGQLAFQAGSTGSLVEGLWIFHNYPNNSNAVTINTNNITVRRNYIFANSYIRNNIIYCDTNNYAIYLNTEAEAASLIISNNVIMGDITTYYTSQYNNILIYGTYTAGTGDINSNNICNGTQYPNLNSNQQNVDMATVFEDYTTYIDNGYLLKTGSLAIGTGVGGVDCGAFGTNDPYVLSGMPPIPAIFETEMTQSIGTSTLPVTIKAKSHK